MSGVITATKVDLNIQQNEKPTQHAKLKSNLWNDDCGMQLA